MIALYVSICTFYISSVSCHKVYWGVYDTVDKCVEQAGKFSIERDFGRHSILWTCVRRPKN